VLKANTKPSSTDYLLRGVIGFRRLEEWFKFLAIKKTKSDLSLSEAWD
jgi:hypothetical protein